MLYKYLELREKRLISEIYFKAVILPLADKNRDARILLLRYYVADNKLH